LKWIGIIATKLCIGNKRHLITHNNFSLFKTTVMVDNNKILVLGGMIDNHAREKHNKVPLLGDIPILGHLFRIGNKRHLITHNNFSLFVI
jgi:type II secretory pathway component GspD/PulD (secretin)